MPWFRYRALDADGVKFASTLEAASTQAAIEEVAAKGLELQAIEPVDDPEAPGTSAAGDNRGPRFEPVDDRPPAAPRDIPTGTTGVAGGFVFLMVGAIFTAIASILIIVGIGLTISGEEGGLFFMLFPLIHLVVGVSMLTYALRGRRLRREVVRIGEVALARVDEIGIQRNVRINGRSPFRMTYSFELNGTTYGGKHTTMNEALTSHRPHDRIWVLYDPDDPSRNVEWPPL